MSKTKTGKAKGSSSKQRPEKLNISEGYCFARGYIMDMCGEYGLPFDIDDDYKYIEDEDYYVGEIGEKVFKFLKKNNSEIKEYCFNNESAFNTRTRFKNFCECTRKVIFSDGYSATNLLGYMSLITAVLVNMYIKNGEQYYVDAMLSFSDVLDFYLGSGEFNKGGGFDALYEDNIMLIW